ncbi:zinc-finger homeodomain protein 5-like [Diospyros lotus]|uniref:zinc-finger homeodomain protein 5-like n=1 Tax=Diospyros lotus TaxID=55363 RepID=UPI0022505520|nr:zinc-finger homeodomain protein 5-like [Diospyros lotus]
MIGEVVAMNQEMLPVDSSSPAGTLMKYTSYMECQKNHAAAIGRTEHDGCQEFLATGPEGTPEALKCAACHCHRNFHRRQLNAVTPTSKHDAFPPAAHRSLPPHLQFVALYGPPPGFQFPLGLPEPPNGKERGGGGGRGSRDFEEQEEIANSTTDTDSNNNAVNKAPQKRFRTRFSREQREKMLGLAEEIGWRTRKEHKEAMRQLCEEIGVTPHVFKVWVKNNKTTLRKKP